MSRWRSRPLLGAALLVLAGGCVEPDPPGVGVQKLAADIVFGVDPPATEVPPPNMGFGPTGPGDAVTYVPSFPAGAGGHPTPGTARPPRAPSSRLPRLTPLSPPRSPCPPAALNAFPAEEAGLNADGTPEEGQYRWKRSGTQTSTQLPGITIPIAGFEQRLVRNVTRVSDTEFTFETVQPELAAGFTTISTFKVKTAGVSRAVNVPGTPDAPGVPRPPVFIPPPPVDVPETPAVPRPPDTVTAGDPERGVTLIRLERIDPAGNSSALNFSPGVLYLPLPIQPGESWTSVGIDPRTGQVLQHQGQVVRRERVDACGEIVDGWAVEATQTFSGAATATRNYRYIVGPQLGGLIISEQLRLSSPEGTLDVTFSLGQTRPSPLPQAQDAGS